MNISSSRAELNDRFKEVYQQLIDQKRIVKNCRERSKSAFAKKLGTMGHIIDLYLKGKRQITYDQVKALCAIYGINEAYMFQGDGTAFGEVQQTVTDFVPFTQSVGDSSCNNILFTNVEAFAGDTVAVEYAEENKRFHIPGLNGDLVAFNINGNSMSPTILAGDMVICVPLEQEDFHKVIDNEIYAVVTNESIWVKRVQKCLDSLRHCTHLKLISDNFQEYDPFTVELNEVRGLLQIKRRLTGMF